MMLNNATQLLPYVRYIERFVLVLAVEYWSERWSLVVLFTL